MASLNLLHASHRVWATGLAVASLGAMLYVGLYQSRAIRHIWCPVFSRGCEAVADAAFAKPFGIPDGYIAAVLYGIILLLLMASTTKLWIWIPLLVLAGVATLANFLGVRDMVNVGSFCFYCMLTTVLSPVLLWEIWQLR
ncbi:MAG: vitamin K epoxide reductase family protein [Candidatus Sulfotelmatobacter sp.]